MPTPLCDAFTLPDPATLHAQGYQGALSYLPRMTRAEIDAYHALGMAVGGFAEFDTPQGFHPVLSGRPAGLLNGAAAAHMLAGLGAPGWWGVIATADTDVLPAQFSTCGGYWDGFRAQQTPGRPIGAYGGSALVDYLIGGGHADFGVISGATSWSAGHTSTRACILQVIDGPNDFDTFVNGHDITSCHLWTATPPTPTPPEPDMLEQFIARNPNTGEIALFTQGLYDRVSLDSAAVTFFEGLGVPNKGNLNPEFFDCTVPVPGGNH